MHVWQSGVLHVLLMNVQDVSQTRCCRKAGEFVRPGLLLSQGHPDAAKKGRVSHVLTVMMTTCLHHLVCTVSWGLFRQSELAVLDLYALHLLSKHGVRHLC